MGCSTVLEGKGVRRGGRNCWYYDLKDVDMYVVVVYTSHVLFSTFFLSNYLLNQYTPPPPGPVTNTEHSHISFLTRTSEIKILQASQIIGI